MKQMLQIRCKNNKKSESVNEGATLFEIFCQLGLKLNYPPVSAKVNNKVEGLHYRVYNSCDIEFLTIESASGLRTYTRSLSFVLCAAFERLFPDGNIVFENAVSNGLYCTLRIGRDVTDDDVNRLRAEMKAIIDASMPIRRHQCPTEVALRHMERKGDSSRVKLLTTTNQLYTVFYQLGDTLDYFYGSLLTSTGGLSLYGLEKYEDGVLLRLPSLSNPKQLGPLIRQDKMFDVFREHHRTQELMELSTVGDFNCHVQAGHSAELINLSEALQEKKISRIAEQIAQRGNVRMVLISGPSSSGKTTFSKRLSIQLMTCGFKPLTISLDDYFVDREKTPKDENGEYDFESLYALDLDYFNADLNRLLAGEEIELPRFDFKEGRRVPSGNKLRMSPNSILVLEGIHALNPELTSGIARDAKFMVYVSALTSVRLDNHNYIPTTDNRLLRRIIRDYKYRGYSAQDTISRWPSVRKGEERWIFPFQENADVMFNSALLVEIAIIRDKVMPVLEQVPQRAPEYSEAYRLMKFLKYFVPVATDQLPPTSLLREFLGGSSFKY